MSPATQNKISSGSRYDLDSNPHEYSDSTPLRARKLPWSPLPSRSRTSPESGRDSRSLSITSVHAVGAVEGKAQTAGAGALPHVPLAAQHAAGQHQTNPGVDRFCHTMTVQGYAFRWVAPDVSKDHLSGSVVLSHEDIQKANRGLHVALRGWEAIPSLTEAQRADLCVFGHKVGTVSLFADPTEDAVRIQTNAYALAEREHRSMAAGGRSPHAPSHASQSLLSLTPAAAAKLSPPASRRDACLHAGE